jgi:hypothetical protein
MISANPMPMVPSKKVRDSFKETTQWEVQYDTYGLSLDPLTQFGCILSALIHDVDHPGVSNSQLIQEQSPLAMHYDNKAMAEQNSVDIAWGILMKPEFSTFHDYVCPSIGEKQLLRQIVVNCVMATDIMDRQVMTKRNAKWDTLFTRTATRKSFNSKDDHVLQREMYRKGTIVMEHLMQASDVSHTMQHWHVYRKWNERLFEETYVAYITGRGIQNPSEYWYYSEIDFFEHFIIPLATKLHECGTFGVAGDEFLSYATSNLDEWKQRGEDIVLGMTERMQQQSMK